jgi:benzoyl-CoA reductase/2-hydroxyglutaryl-CoA dehydratase subunit BcrC/BadD/HgdB
MDILKRIKDAIGKDYEEIVFDKRYGSAEIVKDRGLFADYLKANKEAIDRIRKSLYRPKRMAYFDSIFETDKIALELKREQKKGKKIIGTICNLVPEELIYAAGARPVRLCQGYSGGISHAEKFYPKESCDLIKATLGLASAEFPYVSACDAIAIPATCDGKMKMGECLASIAECWVMEVPRTKDRASSKDRWRAECGMLAEKLSQLTGKEITRKSLGAAIELLAKRTRLLERLAAERKRGAISGRDSMLVIQSTFYDDIMRWMENTEELLTELAAADTDWSRNLPRIILTGSPAIMPNMKLMDAIEAHALVVSDETCAGAQVGYDKVVLDDGSFSDMMRAVSERYLMPSMCPCFVKSEDRIDRLLNLFQECRAEGMINYTIRLCVLFDVESVRLRQVFQGQKIPYLSITADYSKEDMGQIQTRVEAFSEMLQHRR